MQNHDGGRPADPLPMWVADTDLQAPQAVLDGLHAAVDHGISGYPGGPTESYLGAVTGWQSRRFGGEVPPEWVVATPGRHHQPEARRPGVLRAR